MVADRSTNGFQKRTTPIIVTSEVKGCCDCRRANKTQGTRQLLAKIVWRAQWLSKTKLEGHNEFRRAKKC